MVKALKIRALFSDFENGEITDESLSDTVKEIHNVKELYEKEEDEKKKAAYKIAVDEFEKHKNQAPALWQRIEERYSCISQAQ